MHATFFDECIGWIMMEHASTWDHENFNGTSEPDLGDRDPDESQLAHSYGDPVPLLEDHPHLVTMVIKSPQTGLSHLAG